MGMIITALSITLIIVFCQNWGDKKRLPKEVLIAVSGLKPAFDAYRVIVMKEQEEHTMVDAKTELVFSKGTEMFAESIPGGILQIYAVMKLLEAGEGVSTRAVVSIVISALTTGFTSAVLSYDYDSDPTRRRETPNFYGYIPDRGLDRTALLVCMTINSALLLIARGIGAALLMMSSRKYFAWFACGDMGLYFIQKLAREDFDHWLPVKGLPGVLASILMRVVVKTMADYTGVIQLRASGELGGIYWTANMATALASSFVAAEIYFSTKVSATTGSEGDPLDLNSTAAVQVPLVGLDEGGVWWALEWTSAAWFASFALIIYIMKKEYRGTFFSRETGSEWTRKFFLEGKDDRVKSKIMKLNRNKWKSIRGEVKLWVRENWFKWKTERPDWFTDSWISHVPDNFIPAQEDRLVLQGLRRKSSIFGGGGRGLSLSLSLSLSSGATVMPAGDLVENEDE
jgi:hypothetical protein